MAFPEGWTIPADNGFKDVESLRYHALGNAVTPPVIAWLASRVKQYLAETALPNSRNTDSNEPIRLSAAGA
jgi:DNA (cytosine-5)-methyltransferase 1